MDCRFGRSNHSNIQYQQKYLQSQMNYNGNSMIHFQLSQFEWIVIVVDSSIQIHLQNYRNFFHQFEWIPMIYNSICGMISIYQFHNYSEKMICSRFWSFSIDSIHRLWMFSLIQSNHRRFLFLRVNWDYTDSILYYF